MEGKVDSRATFVIYDMIKNTLFYMSLCGFLVLDLLFETESSPIVVNELNKSLVQSLGFGQHFSSETFRKTPCSTLFASNQSFVFLQVHKGSIITSHCKCNVHILHSGHH